MRKRSQLPQGDFFDQNLHLMIFALEGKIHVCDEVYC